MLPTFQTSAVQQTATYHRMSVSRDRPLPTAGPLIDTPRFPSIALVQWSSDVNPTSSPVKPIAADNNKSNNALELRQLLYADLRRPRHMYRFAIFRRW